MTRLTWGAVGERFYEVGVDRGVLFIGDEAGVPWSGLVSVNETPTGGEATPYYVDGVRYLNQVSGEEYQASIEAYTYPDEFAQCDGTAPVKNGLFTTQQARKEFNLSYRTKVGNDVDGVDHAYKIHLVYNAVAAPSPRNNSTIGDSVDPFNFSWQVSTRPSAVKGYRPTPHFVIDSRETPRVVLAQIEDLLYGVQGIDSRLPSVPELIHIFESFDASFFDAGVPNEIYYGTFDGGLVGTEQTSTIDGGVP